MAPCASFLAFLMIGFCVMSSVYGGVEDGLPRPINFPDVPTVTYDGTPELSSDGNPSTCTWYGFANELYSPSEGLDCLEVLRSALTNATVNPPGTMEPYTYYTLKRLVNPATNQSVCYEGCFILPANLTEGAPTSPIASSPSPLASAAPLASTPVVAPAPSSSLSVPTLAPSPTPALSTPTLAPSTPASTPSESPAAAPGLILAPLASSPPSPSAPTGATPPKPSAGTLLEPATLICFLVAFVVVFINLGA